MPKRPPVFMKQAKRAVPRARDERASASERGYDGRWRKARLVYLMSNPLCCACERMGRVEAATVVDHVKPHRGDQTLFWDETNWQPLCATHHGVKTAKEDGGYGNRSSAPDKNRGGVA